MSCTVVRKKHTERGDSRRKQQQTALLLVVALDARTRCSEQRHPEETHHHQADPRDNDMALRALGRGLSRATRTSTVSWRRLSTLDVKEQGEENRYFRKVDEELKAKMRARLDEILASEHEQKQEVIELLGMSTSFSECNVNWLASSPATEERVSLQHRSR